MSRCDPPSVSSAETGAGGERVLKLHARQHVHSKLSSEAGVVGT